MPRNSGTSRTRQPSQLPATTTILALLLLGLSTVSADTKKIRCVAYDHEGCPIAVKKAVVRYQDGNPASVETATTKEKWIGKTLKEKRQVFEKIVEYEAKLSNPEALRIQAVEVLWEHMNAFDEVVDSETYILSKKKVWKSKEARVEYVGPALPDNIAWIRASISRVRFEDGTVWTAPRHDGHSAPPDRPAGVNE